MLQFSDEILRFIAAREACVLVAYRDTSHLAIGFGQNLPGLTEASTMTFDEAVASFMEAIPKFEQEVRTIFRDVPLKQHQFDGLGSITYNVGATQIAQREPILRAAVKEFAAKPDDIQLQNAVGHAMIMVKYDHPTRSFHNFARHCREAVIFTAGDYGDNSVLKLWDNGTSPRHTPPDKPRKVPMPDFRKAA